MSTGLLSRGPKIYPEHHCERTGAGRVDAHKRGVRFGLPKKMNDDQRKLAQRLLKEGKSVREVARTFSVHPATLSHLQHKPTRLGHL